MPRYPPRRHYREVIEKKITAEQMKKILQRVIEKKIIRQWVIKTRYFIGGKWLFTHI
jgi:hypothetical protein